MVWSRMRRESGGWCSTSDRAFGNFDAREAGRCWNGVRAGLELGDGLLLGVDLIKNEETLLAAYNDAAGVTAAFNRNMLVRLNRELGADFDLEAFSHRAIWNASESRIEMHLVSRAAQRVRLAELDLQGGFCRRREHSHGEQLQIRSGSRGKNAGRGGVCPGGLLEGCAGVVCGVLGAG